ncbi:MAG TPA: cytochrome b/b6 domain-containing protein [Gemmatimonadaceae bacterium]|nr:cytochrome b/b6 domain-containing protein [Gemmatimonadaceae bacterium]
MTSSAARSYLYERHALLVRITHWVNVVAFIVLLMSGLQIFNAHPNLYWGKSSYSGDPPLLRMTAKSAPNGERIGVTRVFGRDFETTGVFGLSRDSRGAWTERGFPSWLTLPGDRWLAMGRRWHFFFAWVFVINGLLYLAYSIASRHLTRDLVPEVKEWRTVGQSIKDHLRFRHPTGEAAKHYNVLQKITYLIVVFVLLPLVVLMGLAMSPWLNSLWPGWVDLVGGRQSARTLHFVAAWALVAFVLIHVFEVIISGVWNNLRSMITGRYRIRTGEPRDAT